MNDVLEASLKFPTLIFTCLAALCMLMWARVAAVMTDAELDTIVDDHYRSEAQTLTDKAESNLLAYEALTGRASAESAARWASISQRWQARAQAADGAGRVAAAVDRLVAAVGEPTGMERLAAVQYVPLAAAPTTTAPSVAAPTVTATMAAVPAITVPTGPSVAAITAVSPSAAPIPVTPAPQVATSMLSVGENSDVDADVDADDDDDEAGDVRPVLPPGRRGSMLAPDKAIAPVPPRPPAR